MHIGPIVFDTLFARLGSRTFRAARPRSSWEKHLSLNRNILIATFAFALGACATVPEAPPEQAYEPRVGQEGKDVVWVPTPHVLVEHMLDLAKVTPRDYVIDLGSGDGRNVIAAAKRGARALGVEYNPDLVELSRRNAAEAGVSRRATFVHGDMFEADISQATVLALFLLTTNLDKLAPKFLELRPGTRIVSNGFRITGWEPDETSTATGDCGSWCTAYLYLVPAKVAGTWQLGQGELVLEQNAQTLTGTLVVDGKHWPIEKGRVRGEQVSFTANGAHYTGRVSGEIMRGKVQGTTHGAWKARRASAGHAAERAS
jgi:SAM-dependent methyltransferase